MLCASAYEEEKYGLVIPSCTRSESRGAKMRRVLKDTSIRLIDYGSATIGMAERRSDFGTTDNYRAPEAILGQQWSFAYDIWSIGCIMVELFTGHMLFPGCEDWQHLRMIEVFTGRYVEHEIDPQSPKEVSQQRQQHRPYLHGESSGDNFQGCPLIPKQSVNQ
jgi:dual-specificity kinase